jgi:hypothetical protein
MTISHSDQSNTCWHCIVSLHYVLGAIDKTLLESCCLQGTKYATDSNTCEGYSQSVPGVSVGDQPSCLTILQVCCMKQKQRDQCQNGKSDALSYSRCAIRDDMFGSEQYKVCHSSTYNPVDSIVHGGLWVMDFVGYLYPWSHKNLEHFSPSVAIFITIINPSCTIYLLLGRLPTKFNPE